MKIEKTNTENILKLSKLQEGILLHYLRNSRADMYFEQLLIKTAGVDSNVLHETVRLMTKKYDVLRTVFRWEGISEPVQIVLKEVEPEFHVQHVTEFNSEDILAADSCKKFDLQEVPFRVTVYVTDTDEDYILISNHHILYDGWSNGILVKSLVEIYSRLLEGASYQDLEAPSYSSYIRKILNYEDDETYWQEYLDGCVSEKLNLVCKDELDDKFKEVVKVIDNSKIVDFCGKNYLTKAMFYNAIWAILLKKYDNADDIVFGTTIAGRNIEVENIDRMIGLCINTIPARFNVSGEKKASDFLMEVKENLIKRTPRENTPLANINRIVKTTEDLFSTLVVVENYPVDTDIIDNYKLKIKEVKVKEVNNYPITLGIQINNDSDIVSIAYDNSKYNTKSMHKMLQHFMHLMDDVINNSEKQIKDLNMLTNDEKLFYRLVKEEYDEEFKSVIEWLEDTIKKYPSKEAVIYNDRSISYEELSKQARTWAKYLISTGIDNTTPVCVKIKPSLELVISLLAILYAGGSYIPLPDDMNRERIEAIISLSNSRYLICDNHFEEINIENKIQVETLVRLSGNGIKKRVDSNVMYTLFTSGTTGVPKGVVVEHRNVVKLLRWFIERYEISDRTRSILMVKISSDVSVEDIWGTLVAGGTLHVIDNSLVFDKYRLREYVSDKGITILNNFPGIIGELLEGEKKLENVEKLICGGDIMGEALRKDLLKQGYRLYNNYGMTETTVDTHSKECKLTDEPGNVGVVREGVYHFVLDKDKRLMPLNTVGELFVGGSSLALEYKSENENDSKRFQIIPELGGRVFQTGDYVRITEENELIFYGRNDSQIKLNGFRIELGEIEQEIYKASPYIKDTKVIFITGKTKYLCAFVVMEKEEIEEVKEYLSKHLPRYMNPRKVIKIDKIPIGKSGKVDKKKLEQMQLEDTARAIVLPRNDTEKEIYKVWSTYLEENDWGIDEDFFDMGGNSLILIRVYSQLKTSFEQLSVQDLFDYRTVRLLAKRIDDYALTDENTDSNDINEIEF